MKSDMLIDIINETFYNFIDQVEKGGTQLTTSEQIRVLCVRTGISLSELARRINQSPQNFSAKLKRNTITQDELNNIANVLGVTYEHYFVLSNGEQVK